MPWSVHFRSFANRLTQPRMLYSHIFFKGYTEPFDDRSSPVDGELNELRYMWAKRVGRDAYRLGERQKRNDLRSPETTKLLDMSYDQEKSLDDLVTLQQAADRLSQFERQMHSEAYRQARDEHRHFIRPARRGGWQPPMATV